MDSSGFRSTEFSLSSLVLGPWAVFEIDMCESSHAMVSLIHAAPGDTAIALPRWEPACQRKSDTFVLFASRGLNTATSPQIVLGKF